MKENNMLVNWKLESDVNDYVKKQIFILKNTNRIVWLLIVTEHGTNSRKISFTA